jgi:hypothetical protein
MTTVRVLMMFSCDAMVDRRPKKQKIAGYSGLYDFSVS